MINVNHLTKRYGTVVAVDGLSFEVGPGRVTSFLGPNGAGKTTTLRMLLGLTAPTSGTAIIDGVRYRDLPQPARSVGTALDNDCFHPGRSAIEHLRITATAAGIGRRRAAEVLRMVGLTEAAGRQVGTFSERWHTERRISRGGRGQRLDAVLQPIQSVSDLIDSGSSDAGRRAVAWTAR